MTDETKAEETDKEVPLSEMIGNTWDELASAEAEEAPAESKSEAVESKAETDKTDEPQEGADVGADGPGEGAAEGDEEETVDAPEHWSQTDRDAFSALPEEQKSLYLEKVTSLENGYKTKFNEVADQRKALEPLREFEQMFAPLEQQLRQAGTTPAQYVRNLLAYAAQMQSNPGATLQQLAQQYGVKLGAPEVGEDDYVDPATDGRLKAVESGIANITSHLTQAQSAQVDASKQQLQQNWDSFQTATDQDGKLLYPHAEKLQEDIARLLPGLPPQAGETIDGLLQRAYEKVLWTDPTTRESLLAGRDAEQKIKADTVRKEAVAKAKRAGTVPNSKSSAVDDAPKPADSWRGQLEQDWNRLSETG